LICALIALSVMSSGCSEKQDKLTPEQIVSDFYSHAFKENEKGVLKHLQDQDGGSLGKRQAMIRFLALGAKRCGGVPAMMHERVSGGAQTGILTIKTTFMFPDQGYDCQQWGPREETLILKEKTGWRIR
jgi:hypothetical protein